MDLKNQKEIKKVIDGCIKGKIEDQEQLFKTFYSEMMTVCSRYVNRNEDAKDLLQEGFIKIFDKIDRYSFEGSLFGWVKRIMVNNAIDHYRKNKNKFSLSDTYINAENIAAEEDNDHHIFEEISSEELLEMIQELSPSYRTVFNLFVMEDFSHAEIAEELGISEGASKSNLSKARMNLRQMISAKLKKSNA